MRYHQRSQPFASLRLRKILQQMLQILRGVCEMQEIRVQNML